MMTLRPMPSLTPSKRLLRLGVLPAWTAVHQTGPGLSLMGASGLASILLAGTAITSFGFIQLAIPISALLLVPALAGLGAAIGSINQVSMPLPERSQAMMMRGLWFATLLGMAMSSSCLGLLFGGSTPVAAVIRNVLFNAGLGLLAVKTDGRFVWMPSIVLVLAAMLFGQGAYDGAVAWWAFVLSADVSIGQWVIVAVVGTVGLVNLLRPPVNRL